MIACGVWFVRHEREEGSAQRQIRRIDEEARRGGWIKDTNGTWSLPGNIGTNMTASKQRPGETNEAASGEK